MTPLLIIDFGSQVTQLIARRVRESGVYCEVVPFQSAAKWLSLQKPQGIILSGSHSSALDDHAPRIPQEVFALGCPILGICYGQQALMHQLGGKVESGLTREFGRADIEIKADTPLFKDVWQVGETRSVWMSHGDRVTALAEGFSVIAASPHAPFAAIANETRKIYATQFHIEVAHTPMGEKLIQNFVLNICGIKPDWQMSAYRAEMIAKIRAQVGGEKVICGLSGGVDSAVAAVLIHEAIGAQLTCVFVDHGLMRKGEADEVVNLFKHHYNIPLIAVNAAPLFLGELKGITDPEKKRKTIGRLFIEVFEKEAKAIGGAKFLAQGTLYPDVIESVSFSGGPSVTIKSHHNVGGLPERMNMQLVEPLRELFKDEVRVLGRELGLPEAFVARHPFPGPGLALRIIGDISEEKLALLREIDAVYLDSIRKEGLYNEIWQAFAVLLPIRSVGVMGDGRTYDQVCALRAVTSVDGMTADFYPFTMDFLSRTSTRIINEVKGVNRVTYDITSKPPGTIEWE
jgi:GMP synthase (glutamine-hydrolysing)